MFGKVTSKNVIVLCTFSVFYSVLAKHSSARDSHVLACYFAKYFFFTHRLSKKPFLNWLLTTLPHLKYVTTLHFNLSLMACVADINVSQGSVATYARCGRIFDIHWTANLRRNLVVKDFYNRLRIDRIVVMSLWPRFLAHPVQTIFWLFICTKWQRWTYSPVWMLVSKCCLCLYFDKYWANQEFVFNFNSELIGTGGLPVCM